MARTIQDARQVALRRFLEQIGNRTHHTGTTDAKPANQSELDNLLDSIDLDLTKPLRLDASNPIDRTVSVGASVVANTESGRNRGIPHIENELPALTSGTIAFPSTSGSTITVTPGNNATLTVTSNNYIKFLIYMDINGDLNVSPGTENAVEASATVPSAPPSTLPIGYVTLFNNAGTIDNIAQTKIVQLESIGVTGNGEGKRNYIINGNFDYWQRGTSSTATGYLADRFSFSNGGVGVSAVITRARDTDVPNDDARYSHKMTVTTADAGLANTQFAGLAQAIEGNNFISLWDKTITLSFWVKGSVTGTYSVAFRNEGFTRHYVTEYTIDVANTWEFKTITLTHDSTGFTEKGTGIGLTMDFATSVGSDFTTSTLNSWQAGNKLASTNQVDLQATLNATLFFSQIQLVEGAHAVPFRRAGETIQKELTLCQRYYEKSYETDDAPGTISGEGMFFWTPGSINTGSITANFTHRFKVNKRTTNATVTYYSSNSGASGFVYSKAGAVFSDKNTGLSVFSMSEYSWISSFGAGVGASAYFPDVTSWVRFQYTAEDELQ